MPRPEVSEPEVAPRLSIIIVSYNTREMTLACLASIYRETTQPFEVIVVDNASTDGSAEAIVAHFPDVVLLAEPVNHGFARAHPIAVACTRAPWLLLLNPDTVVLDRALDRLLAFAERTPSAGIWGGRTMKGDGTLDQSSCWSRMSLWSLVCQTTGLSSIFPRSALLNPEAYGAWDRGDEREVDIVTGCLLLIRRETWDTLGGFDPIFEMYGEETDLCLRARTIGVRPRITPEATIIHYGGASDSVRVEKMVRLMRAKTEIVLRHFSPATRIPGRFVLQLWPLSRFLALWLASYLPGQRGLAARARAWEEIWIRRREWRRGFTRPAWGQAPGLDASAEMRSQSQKR